MIDHTGIGVADVKASAAFYDAALGALGLRRVVEMPNIAAIDGVAYGKDHPLFWIDRFRPHGVKQHTAFRAASNAEVDAFHADGLKAGGAGKPENSSEKFWHLAEVELNAESDSPDVPTESIDQPNKPTTPD
jgi:catechol 2,3-dioxygenase-like lactoylglutathione lyase family enzyme